jgi:ubiquinone/menaquinone biosynthesis C-methylase UbiE
MSTGPEILTPAYYQRLYELEQRHGWTRGMRDFAGALLAPMFQHGTAGRILDAGCGTGGMLTWLQRVPGAEIVGIDVSSDALRFSQQRGHRAVVQGSVMDLPFPDRMFDLVVSADVLQHLPDPPGDTAALAEACRVLRPGGYLYVRTNSSFGLGSPTTVESYDYRRYESTQLRGRIQAAGLAVERITYANSLLSLAAIARRRLRGHPTSAHTPYTGLTVQVRPPGLRWVDDVLAALLRAEAWYVTRLGRSLPFGHTLLALARKPAAPAACAGSAESTAHRAAAPRARCHAPGA